MSGIKNSNTWDRLPFSIVREDPPEVITDRYLATLNDRWSGRRADIVAAALRTSLKKDAAR
jgi:hypothetical protein